MTCFRNVIAVFFLRKNFCIWINCICLWFTCNLPFKLRYLTLLCRSVERPSIICLHSSNVPLPEPFPRVFPTLSGGFGEFSNIYVGNEVFFRMSALFCISHSLIVIRFLVFFPDRKSESSSECIQVFQCPKLPIFGDYWSNNAVKTQIFNCKSWWF